jgi:nitrogenase molybdenum-cofactor synthesis protein NifE
MCSPLFDELGLRILGSLSGDARFHEVQTMHRAEVSMVVCAKALLNVARKLETQLQGAVLRRQLLRRHRHFTGPARLRPVIGDPDLTERTEALIAREEAKIHAALEPWRQRLRASACCSTPAASSPGPSSRRCRIWAWKVVATGTNKSTEEDKARIREIMGEKPR